MSDLSEAIQDGINLWEVYDHPIKFLDAVCAVAEWCDKTEQEITEWAKRHNPACECYVEVSYRDCVSQVRKTLAEALDIEVNP